MAGSLTGAAPRPRHHAGPQTHAEPTDPPRRWDVFCHVVDNFGDAAVCWRLARQLAGEHGLRVRLWIDDAQTLARLEPRAIVGASVDGVAIGDWDQAATVAPADVLVCGLGCQLPAAVRTALHGRRAAWVDLEHLSAEDWVAGSHGLPSPKPDGLVEHWFFPGFDERTGGLPRERGLLAERDAFAADPAARAAFLREIGVPVRPGERLASVFCYPGSPVTALADALAGDASGAPWRVLLPEGVAPETPVHPRVQRVPFVPQRDYDRLLWCCDLNWVRGEDSLVRALWAGRPMVWQAYRQPESAHLAKLDAFLRRWTDVAAPPAALAAALTRAHAAWNAAPAGSAAAAVHDAVPALLGAWPAWRTAAARACDAFAAGDDMTTRLVAFVGARL
jgi:uncharacterized repeat protein (TIGR03837 family)